ncbi:hypothetical protein SAMN05421737_11624 [Shouchella lonarensis]|uniref:Uncharacterized protein n=2 Tax=Shouchella lonarensis TaxID=1464122 RepID=A0A1G6PCZ4_9BACI|nr:hypothetical protein SAMN05421737_11624 [Shouchella lonarensis]
MRVLAYVVLSVTGVVKLVHILFDLRREDNDMLVFLLNLSGLLFWVTLLLLVLSSDTKEKKSH